MRSIVVLPDKRLRLVSHPVSPNEPELAELVNEMLETMYDAPGIGLAAIQLGVAKRVITLDLAKNDEPNHPLILLNPEIVLRSLKQVVREEGCLSIPGFYGMVARHESVLVKFQGLDGKEQMLGAKGLMAACIQHEIDHLDGVLFIDKMKGS